MESPCVKKCYLDHVKGLCLGCWRTTEEIANWSSMDDSRRSYINSVIKQRAKEYFEAMQKSVDIGKSTK